MSGKPGRMHYLLEKKSAVVVTSGIYLFVCKIKVKPAGKGKRRDRTADGAQFLFLFLLFSSQHPYIAGSSSIKSGVVYIYIFVYSISGL
jgi:hypothetical protein